MRIEVIAGTLSGTYKWKGGTVFDDTVAPIPPQILKELELHTGTVRLITAEKPIAVVETETEKKEPVHESVLPEPQEDFPEETHQETEGSTETVSDAHEQFEKEEVSIPSTIAQLKRLIRKHGSKAKVAQAIGVAPMTLRNWEIGKYSPTEEKAELIYKAFLEISR